MGNLQKNKVKKAVGLFDMIETVDSDELARKIDEECKKINKVMPALVEINIAKEEKKSGVMPEDLEILLEDLLKLENIRVCGLMTMGPWSKDPEDLRPLFKEAKTIFDRMQACYAGRHRLEYLSMGMSDSYRLAIQEGANMVRIGTAIFGPRT